MTRFLNLSTVAMAAIAGSYFVLLSTSMVLCDSSSSGTFPFPGWIRFLHHHQNPTNNSTSSKSTTISIADQSSRDSQGDISVSNFVPPSELTRDDDERPLGSDIVNKNQALSDSSPEHQMGPTLLMENSSISGSAINSDDRYALSDFDDNYLYVDDNSQEMTPNDGSSSSSQGPPPPVRHPIIYRYYGKKQTISRLHGSLPFVLFGPNIDHWKITAQELAARGYNAITCERANDTPTAQQQQQEQSIEPPTSKQRHHREDVSAREAVEVILTLLDLLRWNRIILVACDTESTLAVKAAMQLAPQRIAGLVLCGQIENVNTLRKPIAWTDITDYGAVPTMHRSDSSLDEFLEHSIQCPFIIVWDGRTPSLVQPKREWGMTSEQLNQYQQRRALILGGGDAPHRRRPQYFAWILTRFVEEQVVPPATTGISPRLDPLHIKNQQTIASTDMADPGAVDSKLPNRTPGLVGSIFSAESMVVGGRVLATVLLYASMVRILLYQYENANSGMLNVRGKLHVLATWQTKVVSSLSALVWKLLAFIIPAKRMHDQDENSLRMKNVTSDLSIEDIVENNESSSSFNETEKDKMYPPDRYTTPLSLLDNVIA